MTNHAASPAFRAAFLCCLIGSLIASSALHAQGQPDHVRVTAPTGANIRIGASTSQPVILAIRVGTMLPVLQVQGEWFMVSLSPELGTPAHHGFIHRSTVEAVRAEWTAASQRQQLPTPQTQHVQGSYTGAISANAGIAGASAGASKSVAAPAVYAAAGSVLFPGAGFIYLLFLRSGEVTPNFAEQAHLRGKSPEYIAAWTESYDQALTAKQKKAIIIGASAGSVLGYLLVMRPLLSAFGSY
jgi:hypothetical protein